MNTFQSYVIAGFLFFSFGVWGLYKALCRYFWQKYVNNFTPVGEGLEESKTYPWLWPLEPILQLIGVLIGIVVEFSTGVVDDSFYYQIINMEHMIIYLFFGLNALIKMANYSNLKNNNSALVISHLEGLTLSLAFGIEGFILSGIGEKDYFGDVEYVQPQMHTLLAYIILGCLIFTILCEIYPNVFLLQLSQIFCIIFQGTWFWQIALFVYTETNKNKNMDEEFNESVVHGLPFEFKLDVAGMDLFLGKNEQLKAHLLTLAFTLHIMLLLILITFVYGYASQWIMKKLGKPEPEEIKTLEKSDNVFFILNHDDYNCYV